MSTLAVRLQEFCGKPPANPHIAVMAKSYDAFGKDKKTEALREAIEVWGAERPIVPPLLARFSKIVVEPKEGATFYAMAVVDPATDAEIKKLAHEHFKEGDRARKAKSAYVAGGTPQHARDVPYHVTLTLSDGMDEEECEEFIRLLAKHNSISSFSSPFAPRPKELLFTPLIFQRMRPEITSLPLDEKLQRLVATFFGKEPVAFGVITGSTKNFISLTPGVTRT